MRPKNQTVFLPVLVLPGRRVVEVRLESGTTAADVVEECLRDTAAQPSFQPKDPTDLSPDWWTLVADFKGFEKRFTSEERLYQLVRKHILLAENVDGVRFYLQKKKKRYSVVSPASSRPNLNETHNSDSFARSLLTNEALWTESARVLCVSEGGSEAAEEFQLQLDPPSLSDASLSTSLSVQPLHSATDTLRSTSTALGSAFSPPGRATEVGASVGGVGSLPSLDPAGYASDSELVWGRGRRMGNAQAKGSANATVRSQIYASQAAQPGFGDRSELLAHLEEAHGNYRITRNRSRPPKRTFSDPATGETFSTKAALSEHFEESQWKVPDDYHPPTNCPYCDAALDGRTALLDHVSQFHRQDIGLDQDFPEPGSDHTVDTLSKYVAQHLPERSNEASTPEGLHRIMADLIQRQPMDFFRQDRRTEHESAMNGNFQREIFRLHLTKLGNAAAAFGLSLGLMRSLLTALLKRVVPQGRPLLKVQLEVMAETELSYPILIPFMYYDPKEGPEEIVDAMMTSITYTFTSRQRMFLDDDLEISVSFVKLGPGSVSYGALWPGENASGQSYTMRSGQHCCWVPHSVRWANDCALTAIFLGLRQKEDPKGFPKSLEVRNTWASVAVRNGIQALAAQLDEFSRRPIDWDQPQDVPTLVTIQKFLDTKDLQLIVYSGHKLSTPPIFKGSTPRPISRQISLIHFNNAMPDLPGHVSLIADPEKFFKAKYCHGCLKLIPKTTSGRKHNFVLCQGFKRKCQVCLTSLCPLIDVMRSWGGDEESSWECGDCHGHFTNHLCFQLHKTLVPTADGPSTACDELIHCVRCGIRLPRDENSPRQVPHHNCGLTSCKNCKQEYSILDGKPHFCAIQPAGPKDLGTLPRRSQDSQDAQASTHPLAQAYPDLVGKTAIVFFDFETRQNLQGRLVPFALVAYFMCSKCCFNDFMDPDRWTESYSCCGKRRKSYVGMAEICEFVRTLFFRMRRFKRVHAFAFNGSRFDFVFIADILLSNGVTPSVRMRGRNILWLKHRNVILKDLVAYIPGTLSALPKTFKFSEKVEKGFFPHKYSDLVDNDHVAEGWPERGFFEPHKFRSRKEVEDLDAFLASKAGQPFHFMDECLKYCDLDVLILAMATLALEKATLEDTNRDISFIHSSSFTLAGLSSVYFRHMFMTPNSIGLVPVHGYANLTNVQSQAAEIYFRWLNLKRRLDGAEEIHYSKSSIYGEHKVGNLRVDGVTSSEMWEYDSCFHHAAPCCYRGRMQQRHPLYGTSYAHVRYLDVVRKHRIRQINPGKTLHVIRHCQVMDLLRTDADFREFYQREKDSVTGTRHVKIRDAIYGGRVENLAVVVELTPSEIKRGVRIDLVDVVSEYPYVQFSKKYPARLHPQVVPGSSLPDNGKNMTLAMAQTFFGLFTVFVVPPTDVIFPTVPFRTGKGRTLYGLCASCMREGGQEACRHVTDEERGWQATLTSPDLEQALRDGFRVAHCHEVLDWGAGETTTELFSSMIRHLIKGKVQSKEGAEDLDPQRRAAMREAWAAIGVQLDEDGWQGNPARYQFYKVLLNSLWGKLAQNQHKISTKFIKRWSQLTDILENETKELQSVQPTSSDVLICQITEKDEHIDSQPVFFNPFIAALVTSYARLHITSFMRKIGFGSPYYLDTDSLIYKSDPGGFGSDPPLDKNKLLGSLVSEIPPGHFIKVILLWGWISLSQSSLALQKIVILAPKCYVYLVYSLADPFAAEPVETVIKMKGMFLRVGVKEALGVEALEKLALGTFGEEDAAAFDAALEGKGWEAGRPKQGPGHLLLPQPRLDKARHAFAISANDAYAKTLSARFDKRLLRTPKLYKDFAQDPTLNPDPFHPSHYPSLPFGFKSPLLGNDK